MEKFIQKWRADSQKSQKEKTRLKDHQLNATQICQPPELSTQSESTLNKENVLNESTDSTSTPIRPHKKRQSVRKYQPNWLQTFSWIKYEEASD
ncbi:hypothetical protein Bhyg_09001 [Pseudolycoriella hygida]|uniref:Uncharacterized protein n=1 Tax=Pseudolycoriella hygida TaxID=35572 RepID=A0A9Q0S5C9_9DIPT|nr:hypothetical protein Bhyg_09001 [Pseudolycoriella hygida]